MLANIDDIKECYLAGLKKSRIIEHYKIPKPRLNRILEGLEPPKKPESYNDYLLAPDLMEYICSWTDLASVMKLARQVNLDPNKMYDLRKNAKYEDINLIKDMVFLLNAGVKKTSVAELDFDGDGGGIDISGLRKILKRHNIEIKPNPKDKIKMTPGQKETLKKLYIKHNISATFPNAVKIIHYFTEFLTDFDANDFIDVLLEVGPKVDADKFSKNLQYFTIGAAMHEFEGYIKK